MSQTQIQASIAASLTVIEHSYLKVAVWGGDFAGSGRDRGIPFGMPGDRNRP